MGALNDQDLLYEFVMLSKTIKEMLPLLVEIKELLAAIKENTDSDFSIQQTWGLDGDLPE